MQTTSDLDSFEAAVLQAVQRHPDGLPQNLLTREYQRYFSVSSMKYRIDRLYRRGEIQIEDLAGRRILYPAAKQE